MKLEEKKEFFDELVAVLDRYQKATSDEEIDARIKGLDWKLKVYVGKLLLSED